MGNKLTSAEAKPKVISGKRETKNNRKLVDPAEQETENYLAALHAITHVYEPLTTYQHIQNEVAQILELLLSDADGAEGQLAKLRYNYKVGKTESIVTGGMFAKKYNIEKLSKRHQQELLRNLKESIGRKVLFVDRGFACRMLPPKADDQQIIFEIEAIEEPGDSKQNKTRPGQILKRFDLPVRKLTTTEATAAQFGARRPLPEADGLEVRNAFEAGVREIQQGNILKGTN